MKEILSGYRCECGKLLLKGFIFIGEIEVKCRYCKKMTSVSGINGSMSNERRYLLVTDKTGNILRATASASSALGYTGDELRKMNIKDIFPSIKDKVFTVLWSKLKTDEKKAVIFRTEQFRKEKETVTVQIGARAFQAATNKELFLFDIDQKKPEMPKKLNFRKKTVKK
jgi:PAS domain S-box-containing protein